MRESVLQKQCLDWTKRNFWGRLLAVNIHGSGYSNKGFPDIIVFGRQKAIVVELKQEKGYALQPDQLVWKKRFQSVGTPHYLVKTLEGFMETVRKEFPNETS